jgi:hypothetical protein
MNFPHWGCLESPVSRSAALGDMDDDLLARKQAGFSSFACTIVISMGEIQGFITFPCSKYHRFDENMANFQVPRLCTAYIG